MLKAVTLLLLLIVSAYSVAAEIEVGVGAFTTVLPKYMGSNEQDTYTVPFPFFYYKSEQIEVNRNTFTGFLMNHKHWYLDLSASGNIPVDSQKTKAREGMPDLDFVGEIGPAVKYYFVGHPASSEQLNMSFNVRKGYAIDTSNLDSVGWRYGSNITYNKQIPSVYRGNLSLSLAANVNYASSDYSQYYYGVTNEFVTSSRPEHHANSGYLGSAVSAGITWRRNSWWLGSFVKYNSFHNTSQKNSPLLTDKNNWSLGIGVAWIFYKNH